MPIIIRETRDYYAVTAQNLHTRLQEIIFQKHGQVVTVKEVRRYVADPSYYQIII